MLHVQNIWRFDDAYRHDIYIQIYYLQHQHRIFTRVAWNKKSFVKLLIFIQFYDTFGGPFLAATNYAFFGNYNPINFVNNQHVLGFYLQKLCIVAEKKELLLKRLHKSNIFIVQNDSKKTRELLSNWLQTQWHRCQQSAKLLSGCTEVTWCTLLFTDCVFFFYFVDSRAVITTFMCQL